MPYGAISPSHRERFEPGSIKLADAVPLNLRHDPERAVAYLPGGGLKLTETPQALRMAAELPPIPAADRALAEVRSGRLAGLSVEFHAERERMDNGIRVIESAVLTGIGLVDAPSYPTQIENRGAWKKAAMEPGAKKRRPWARSTVPTGRVSDCECVKPVTQVSIRG